MTTIGGLPFITLLGGPADRGEQHGTALKERIHGMIEVYGSFFGRPESEIFDIAGHFKSVINDFEPDYGTEIEAIAAAVDVNPLWIYALNARSEFLSFVPTTECTVMHFAGTPLLGQNWDWEERLEPLIALARIERTDGPSILMMTEPGILGKIGLNDSGIGVCFNFLHINRPTNGVPIHILLRAILECSSIDAARETIDRAGTGRSANILVADESGARFDMEFAATKQIEVDDPGDVLAHTNHYLDPEMFSVPHILENSKLRLNRAYALAKETETRDRATLVQMLSDTANPGNSICQTYRPREPLGNMGTVCTLTMDLAARNMDIRLGNDASAALERVELHPRRVAAE